MISKEGTGKSTISERLGLKKWFSNTFNFGMVTSGSSVRAFEQLRGVWIIETPEMSGMGKAEVENVKAFITSSVDAYRGAYKEESRSFNRQCVFIGTSNNRDFLVSQTGNRRFWPIDVYKNKPTRQVSELANEAVIGQIWAEAVTFYLQGEKLYLDPEQEAIARKVQESHTEEDDWSSIISEYLEIQIPDHWYTLSQSDKVSFIRSQRGEFTYGDKYLSYQFIKRDKVTATEIWLECFIGDIQKLDRRTTMRIKTIMRKLEGWEEPTTKIRISGGTPVRGFVRKVNTPCLQ